MVTIANKDVTIIYNKYLEQEPIMFKEPDIRYQCD
jgi:hypothetical protein